MRLAGLRSLRAGGKQRQQKQQQTHRRFRCRNNLLISHTPSLQDSTAAVDDAVLAVADGLPTARVAADVMPAVGLMEAAVDGPLKSSSLHTGELVETVNLRAQSIIAAWNTSFAARQSESPSNSAPCQPSFSDLKDPQSHNDHSHRHHHSRPSTPSEHHRRRSTPSHSPSRSQHRRTETGGGSQTPSSPSKRRSHSRPWSRSPQRKRRCHRFRHDIYAESRSRSHHHSLKRNGPRSRSPHDRYQSGGRKSRSPPERHRNNVRRSRSPPERYRNNGRRSRSPPERHRNNDRKSRSPHERHRNNGRRSRSPLERHRNNDRKSRSPHDRYRRGGRRSRSPLERHRNNDRRSRSPHERHRNNFRRNHSPPERHRSNDRTSRSPYRSLQREDWCSPHRFPQADGRRRSPKPPSVRSGKSSMSISPERLEIPNEQSLYSSSNAVSRSGCSVVSRPEWPTTTEPCLPPLPPPIPPQLLPPRLPSYPAVDPLPPLLPPPPPPLPPEKSLKTLLSNFDMDSLARCRRPKLFSSSVAIPKHPEFLRKKSNELFRVSHKQQSRPDVISKHESKSRVRLKQSKQRASDVPDDSDEERRLESPEPDESNESSDSIDGNLANEVTKQPQMQQQQRQKRRPVPVKYVVELDEEDEAEVARIDKFLESLLNLQKRSGCSGCIQPYPQPRSQPISLKNGLFADMKFPKVNVNEVLPLPLAEGAEMLNRVEPFRLPLRMLHTHLVDRDLDALRKRVGKSKAVPPPFIPISRSIGRTLSNALSVEESQQCSCSTRDAIGCGSRCINRMTRFECNPDQCRLGDRCTNQVLQRREHASLSVRHFGEKGWGLVLEEDVKRGQLITEYVGEVIDLDECERRLKEDYDSEGLFYFFNLCSTEVVDATRRGNCCRFINHSCNPSFETQKWHVNGELRVGVFASRDQPAGTEVTFDYMFERFGALKQECLCGAANCRGFLGAKRVAPFSEPAEQCAEEDVDESRPDELETLVRYDPPEQMEQVSELLSGKTLPDSFLQLAESFSVGSEAPVFCLRHVRKGFQHLQQEMNSQIAHKLPSKALQ